MAAVPSAPEASDRTSEKRKHHKKRSERKHDKKRRERSPTPEKRRHEERKSIYEALAKKIFLEETGLAPERAFRKDKKSDRNNLAFTTLYRLHVPKYHENSCIVAYSVKSLTKRKKLKSARFFDKKSAPELPANPIDMSRSRLELPPTTDVEYIPIESSPLDASVKQTRDSNTQTIKFSSMADDDASEKRQAYPVKPSQEQLVYNKTQEYNDHLRKHPHDIEKWLEFVNFQDKVNLLTNKEDVNSSAVAEKKLSIFEKALESNPKCAELLIRRLQTAKSVWSAEQISSEWKKLSFLYPNNTDIWLNYLNFARSHLTYFTTQKVLKIYSKCFGTLIKIVTGEFQTHRANQDLENKMVDIFVDYAKFLSDVGLIERSIASFQALIEFNNFTPQILTRESSLVEWLTFFEPFWDSGVPRFGELNWCGWAKTMETKKFPNNPPDVSELEYNEKETALLGQNLKPDKAWLMVEELREQYHWMPVKGEAADAIEDLDRNVLLDDIRFCLFQVTSPETKYRIMEAFIDFLLREADHEQTEIHPNLKASVKFTNYRSFIDTVFQKTIEHFKQNSDVLIERWIAFKLGELRSNRSKSNIKETRTFIKNILKNDEHRNNLRVWKQYAKFEEEFGDAKMVRKLYETGLEMASSIADKNSFLEFVLCYVEHLLQAKPIDRMGVRFVGRCDKTIDDTAARSLVLGLVGERTVTVTPSVLLKAKRTVDAWNEESKLSAEKAYFLLLYLTQGLATATKQLEDCLVHTPHEEKLFELYIWINLIEVQRRVKSLRSLRLVLNRALTAYPTNESFLAVLLDVDSKMVVTGQANK